MTTDTTTPDVRAQVRRVPLDDIVGADSNVKAHDVELVADSIRRFGFADPVIVDQRTGELAAGHGRTAALRAMRDAGEDPPRGINARWEVPVYVGWASADDAEADAARIALNRTTEAGGWDEPALLDLLERLADVDDGLVGVGYDDSDLDDLRARLGRLDEPEPRDPKPWPHRAADDATCRVLVGPCEEVMGELDADSIDALVTDPPYALGFMGREWDRKEAREFGEWCRTWGEAALRVVKPGGHLVAFGGTRTHHRLMAGLEDAGWEIRDCGVWLYRSGFPKSHDVAKALDRQDHPDADEWDGWGTALKPSIEPWVLARAPLSEPSVAANVTRWGTGAINVDACRAEMSDEDREKFARGSEAWHRMALRKGDGAKPADVYGTYGIADPSEADADGRWPANVVTLEDDEDLRFFLAAVGPVADYTKAGADEKPWATASHGLRYVCELHPTVKPLALMRHLVRLVTPPGGTVLDPFGGSGTTGEAAIIEGFDAVLIEREPAYVDLINRRLARTSGDADVVDDTEHSALG